MALWGRACRYRGDDVDSMFHYARAVLAVQPFATARENLRLLLDKNKQKLDALLANQTPAPPRVGLGELSQRFESASSIASLSRSQLPGGLS